ncbi:MAG TPA: S-formylglutathione hydrolase [Steroidobacteraceae bacterium]|nr:S-formylglutathione hydrolase [Steroidobacteraceae bacterium]
MELISEHGCFGGLQRFYKHASRETRGPMKFSVYLPPAAMPGPGKADQSQKVPVLYYLAGLTCTEETFPIKAHAQQVASELGIMLVAPDTSPREPRIPGDADSWDFGQGAGFYVDATQAPWSTNYRMYSYVTKELPELVAANLPAKADATGVFGHSMGGHGALVCALRNPGRYKSVSAFAPIAAPMQCPWGQKGFHNYLGPDMASWREYDASELVARKPFDGLIRIDQGKADPFLAQRQLLPEKFAAAAEKSGQKLDLKMRDGYDHGYYFIQTFMADHLRHHAAILKS